MTRKTKGPSTKAASRRLSNLPSSAIRGATNAMPTTQVIRLTSPPEDGFAQNEVVTLKEYPRYPGRAVGNEFEIIPIRKVDEKCVDNDLLYISPQNGEFAPSVSNFPPFYDHQSVESVNNNLRRLRLVIKINEYKHQYQTTCIFIAVLSLINTFVGGFTLVSTHNILFVLQVLFVVNCGIQFMIANELSSAEYLQKLTPNCNALRVRSILLRSLLPQLVFTTTEVILIIVMILERYINHILITSDFLVFGSTLFIKSIIYAFLMHSSISLIKSFE